MSTFGIRNRLKRSLKKVLGVGPGADTTPPNWQSRPPEPQAPAPAAVPPAEEAPPPAAAAPPAEEPLLKETAPPAEAVAAPPAEEAPAPSGEVAKGCLRMGLLLCIWRV